MQAPLSPIQCAVPHSKGDGHRSRKAEDRMHMGKAQDSTKEKRSWRPKRASDRLLQPESASVGLSPPQKKKTDLSGSSLMRKTISVQSVDSLAKLRGEKHVTSMASSASSLKAEKHTLHLSSFDPFSEDDSVFSSKIKNKSSAINPHSCRSSSSSPVSSVKLFLSQRTQLYHKQAEDVREKERQRWMEFREKKMPNQSAILRLRLKKKPTQTETEPIVLSSEEENDVEDTGGWAEKTSQSSSNCLDNTSLSNSEINAERSVDEPQSFLQLAFTSFHVGLVNVEGNGKILITESGISIPLKGLQNEQVTVVASQLKGYGVWDGRLAQDGSLLAFGKGPAPSLLFLWVSDAQANLLHKELFAIRTPTSASDSLGEPCSCLLLVLKGQLQNLQAALLASILDMEEYKKGRLLSTGLTSPLDWSEGLLIFHSCPPPLDQHLLKLMGHSSESSRTKSNPCSSRSQDRCSRLIQYPAAPSKGRITVTKEDLACLNSGEFLNDVIIDFYLKYLLLEGVKASAVERSHVFSSFFYKQLSRRRAVAEGDAPYVPDRTMRHQRVKTWTRHVDIFTKDFLFVPVNQEAHWYLVVVCFAGLEKAQYEEFQKHPGGSEKMAEKTSAFSMKSLPSPDCTYQGCQRDTILKRPCILIMDSLKISYHENVCRLIRDYLHVEWQIRRGTPRLFTEDNMKSFNCRVPLQENSSDCGLYLLQYVESFLMNPVVHYDFPLRLDNWFPRQHVRQKREGIRNLIMRMNRSQQCECNSH